MKESKKMLLFDEKTFIPSSTSSSLFSTISSTSFCSSSASSSKGMFIHLVQRIYILLILFIIISSQFQIINCFIDTNINNPNVPYEDLLSNVDNETCLSDECMKMSVVLQSSMDMSTNPCDNFFHYACGGWIEEHPIPKYRNSWSQFELFLLQIRNEIKKWLDNPKPDDFKFENTTKRIFNKLYQFYHGCLDKNQRNANGYSELFDLADKLGGWPLIEGHLWNESRFNWEEAYITLANLNIQYFISINPMVDLKNTSKIIAKLGPPYQTRDNIINLHDGIKLDMNNIKNKDFSQVYFKMIEELLSERNITRDPSEIMDEINAIFNLQNELENNLSDIPSMSHYQDHYEEYIFSIKELNPMLHFNITHMLKQIFQLDFKEDAKIFVPDLEYLKKLGPLLNSTNKKILANYFATNMAYQLGRHTTIKLLELLVSKLDAPEVLPNICFAEIITFLPEFLGKFYLEIQERKLNKKSIENIQYMSELLRQAFLQQLQKSDWMDEDTKSEAIVKLGNMGMNIAYPEWYDNEHTIKTYLFLYQEMNCSNYIESVIHVNSIRQYIENVMLSENFVILENHVRPTMLNWSRKQIIDVNAFYYFTANGVYIPAGILRDTIYSANLPGAITFGSIGMIIGHEMAHAFDASGKLYDQYGSLRNWWSNKTTKEFQIRSQCFNEQYSNYSLLSVQLNGTKTLAENIADNSGLREAYRAFNIYKDNNPEEKWRLPGSMSKFSKEQLFFLSFAHMWCTSADENAIKIWVENNEHSPPQARVWGSLVNNDAFSKAFNCPLNSPMNPKKKCILW